MEITYWKEQEVKTPCRKVHTLDLRGGSMRPKKLVGLMLVLGVLLLTGCAGEFHTDLYVQDVLEVASGEEEYVLTTGTIFVESPGEDFNAQLQAILEATFRDVKNVRTGTGEYGSKVIADLKVPVVLFEDSQAGPWAEEALAVLVMPMEEGHTAFGLMLNGEKIDGIFASFLEDSFYSVGVKDFTFYIKLNNDLRELAAVYLQGVYANGRPLPYAEVLTLERREAVEIKPSDVSRDYAYQQGAVLLGALQPVD